MPLIPLPNRMSPLQQQVPLPTDPTQLLNPPITPDVAPIPADKQGPNGEMSQLAAAVDDEEKRRLFDYPTAQVHFKRLIDSWAKEVRLTDGRRKTRRIDINIKQLRDSGKIKADETVIPVRTINTNIEREKPTFIQYIKTSRRLVIFKSLDNPNQPTGRLEEEFTRGMTYLKWEKSIFKAVDGAQAHGWDAVEVLYDTTKPLNVAIEHIGHDQLVFPDDSIDIQFNAFILRQYRLTVAQLKEYVVKFGFDAEQVKRIEDQKKDTQKEQETIVVYKRFHKYQGVVYLSWFAYPEVGTDNWLKAPAPLFIGVKHQVTKIVDNPIPSQQIGPDGSVTQILIPNPTPVQSWEDTPIDMYPIFLLPYTETEEEKIFDHKGRVYLDGPKQEAQTAITSAFCNGITRASNIYGAPTVDNNDGQNIKLADIRLENGTIVSKPFQFWSPPYPDPIILKGLQWLDVSNSQETGQLTYAANNRQDSRKTATEIQSAQQNENQLNVVSLTLFSTFIREIYTFSWKIVQSQALQGEIKFILIPQQQPVAGIPMIPGIPQQTETVFVNDIKTIGQSYDIRAAGDVDVVKREERINMMMQDWPVIQTTPLAMVFLSDILKLKYPDDGERYAQILMSGNPIQMMGALVNIIKGMMQDNPMMIAMLSPQDKQGLQQVLMQCEQMMAASAPSQQPAQPNQPQNGPPNAPATQPAEFDKNKVKQSPLEQQRPK